MDLPVSTWVPPIRAVARNFHPVLDVGDSVLVVVPVESALIHAVGLTILDGVRGAAHQTSRFAVPAAALAATAAALVLALPALGRSDVDRPVMGKPLALESAPAPAPIVKHRSADHQVRHHTHRRRGPVARPAAPVVPTALPRPAVHHQPQHHTHTVTHNDKTAHITLPVRRPHHSAVIPPNDNATAPARPSAPAVMAPAPPPADVLWSHPGMYVAWGLANGQFNAEQLAAHLEAMHYRWVTLEVTPDNLAYAADLAAAAARHNLRYGIWEVPGDAASAVQHVHDYGASFYIANIEGPFDAATFVPAFRAALPDVDAAVVTNFGGIDGPADAAPWIQGGFAAQPEAYQNDNPNATPSRVAFAAQQRGWAHSYPVLGTYHGYDAAQYVPDLANFGEGFSVYLAEGISDADEAALEPVILAAEAAGPTPHLPRDRD